MFEHVIVETISGTFNAISRGNVYNVILQVNTATLRMLTYFILCLTGVYLLDFFCSGIQFYLLLSPYLCFISLLYLDLYVLGDVRGLSCKPNIYVS